MTQESSVQVERKVVEIVGELYGSYTPLRLMKKEDIEWLAS